MKRARNPEQKAERRDAILNAAAECFLQNSHILPSAAEVARQAGVAKGTVYIYFKTKEEIFLALFQHKLIKLLTSLKKLSSDESAAKQLAELLIQFNTDEPDFLPLAGMLQSVLEANLQAEILFEFKKQLAELLEDTGSKLDNMFNLPDGFSERALLHSYCGLIGLWQMLLWSSSLPEVYNREAFRPLDRNLEEELSSLIEKIWRQ